MFCLAGRFQFVLIMRLLTLLILFAVPIAVQSQDYTFATNNGTITITGYTGSGGVVTIPDTINGLSVTGIGDSAFFGFGLTSVSIPNSVTNIGDEAFFYCFQLTAVFFQGNAPNLGLHVFGSPTFFDGFDFPDCYYLPGTTGWDSTFGGCSSFLIIPPFYCTCANGVVTINGYTGSGGMLIIPNMIENLPVTDIASDAFKNVTLTSVTIPNSITNIGSDAFTGCSLASITFLSGSHAHIGEDAFLYCGNLTNITFPDSGAIGIGMFAFNACDGLSSITIPKSVAGIEYGAFAHCSSLTNVLFSSSDTGIGEFAFYYCTALTSVCFTDNAPGTHWTAFMGANQAIIYYLPGTTGWGSTLGGNHTAPWLLPYPVILNNSSSFGLQNDGFGFTISWATNISVVVESCTNFANPQWQPVQTNTITGGTSYFNDPQWTNYPSCFYRLRSLSN